MIVGLTGSSISVVLFAFANSSPEWLVLRLINGFCAAMALVPLETLVYQNAGPLEKAKVFRAKYGADAEEAAKNAGYDVEIYPRLIQ